MESILTVELSDGSHQYKGACLSGLYSGVISGKLKRVISWTEIVAITLQVRKVSALDEAIAIKFLNEMEKWGFGKFSLGHEWKVLSTEVNVVKWFIIYSMLRNLWENPRMLWVWNQWSISEPTYDTWLLFVLVHKVCAVWDGHTLLSSNTKWPCRPKEVLDKLTAVTGFDWTLKRNTNVSTLFNSNRDIPYPFDAEEGAKGNYYDVVTPSNWRDRYAWFANQTPHKEANDQKTGTESA